MGQPIMKIVITFVYILLSQAVKVLLASRDSLERENSNQSNIGADGSQIDIQSQLDPFQVSCSFA